jgi:peptide/nickel transport system ATP-binding protein
VETADRLAVMYAGQIVETGDVQSFFQGPAHPYSRKLLQSLPDRHRRDQRLAVIPGSVPALGEADDGCRFAPRCELADARCRRETPPWHPLDNHQGVRCLRVAEEPAPSQLERPADRADTPPQAGTGPEPLLEVSDLKVHFPIRQGLLQRLVGQVRAVDGVSLSIPQGRTLALVGESGCGKTTVGKAILQLIRATSGSVRFAGDELTRLQGLALRRHRAALQIIFQDPLSAMNPRLRVEEIVAEGMRAQRRLSRKQRRDRVLELLQQVGLPESAAVRYPHEFSGGQRQRICIARALAVEPRLIVCDEPTSALDVSVQAQVINLMQRLQRELGLSYLFISHNLSVVAYLADQVAVMYLGRIVEQGRVEEVLQRPAHPYTQALLSAVPVADPSRRRPVIRLAGDMPSPAHPPEGCHFHPRCTQAREICATHYPTASELGSGHWASCWLLSDTDREGPE